MKTVPHRLLLTYRGEDFFGWQRQDPAPTVQLALEQALQKIYGLPVSVAGSGRTDRNVHALGQVASCEIPLTHTPDTLAKALNFHLPAGVRVLAVRREKPGFHARFSAKGKTYLY
ncbi:tRNA pseudouridine(38-40) synthase TruA, partial [bacterium]|nr:tRNA pseudouridine(38-40) synthase TruA [bacterium]